MATRKTAAAGSLARMRGSERLAARSGFAAKDLGKLVALSQKQGVKLVHWTIYGQPAPDGVSGAFQVNPKLASSVIAALMKVRGLGLDVFPYGTPVPRDTMVRFRSQFAGGVVITNG